MHVCGTLSGRLVKKIRYIIKKTKTVYQAFVTEVSSSAGGELDSTLAQSEGREAHVM